MMMGLQLLMSVSSPVWSDLKWLPGGAVQPVGGGGGGGVGVAWGSAWVGHVADAGTGPEFQTVDPFVLIVTPPAEMLTLIKHELVNGTVKQFAAPPATVPEQLRPLPKALLSPGFQLPDTWCVPAAVRLPFSMLRKPPIGSKDVAPSDVTVHSVSQFAELPWVYVHPKTGVIPQECKPLECSVVLDGWSRFSAVVLVLKLAQVCVCAIAYWSNAREANTRRWIVFIVFPLFSFRL
jgi:hypothetical protein